MSMRRAVAARPAQQLKRYRSLASFYTADDRRIHSRERDIGLWWREDVDGPLHRAAWVGDTGELYLVRLGSVEEGGGQVEVLATVLDSEQLDRALEGWRERCGEPRSLSWLRERAASARAGPRTPVGTPAARIGRMRPSMTGAPQAHRQIAPASTRGASR
jgi:hypothetical protein